MSTASAGKGPATSTSTIGLISTLDTKSAEIDYVRRVLHELGATTLVIDSGILGEPGIAADITREQVARAGGYRLEQVQNAGSRGAAVEMMQESLSTLARHLYDTRQIGALLCLGGAEGALLGASAMQALPLGVPKVIVSPSASGRREFGPFMGSADIMVMHSVIDILGLNAISKRVFTNAAAAVWGMCHPPQDTSATALPAVGITMLGQTTPGAMVLAAELERAGYEPVIFHANGVGGPALDAYASQGALVGVIDFTVSEVANSLMGGLHATDETRMTAAVTRGLPLLVVPGAADFFNQGPLAGLPQQWAKRQLYKHNPVATLVRMDVDQMRELAREIARRIGPATAPTEVVVPMGGFSLVGVPGGPLADADADAAFLDELRSCLPPHLTVTSSPDSINDARFARTVAERFIALMARAH